jgi:dTDP-4-dehydrorhamnose 3,5-epimerase
VISADSFFESFQAERYRDKGITDHFVQDNHSRSRQGVLRGLRFQVRDGYPRSHF